jgi:mRNA interferase RelE/StbE
MAWKIEVSPFADRDLAKLEAQHSRRILKSLHERVANLHDPRSIGKAMQGPFLGNLWGIPVGRFPDHLQN